MIYIADETKHVGDFGSTATIKFFEEVADNLDLEYLTEFLTNGFTINIRETINDIESVVWPEEDGFAEIASMVITALMKCKNIAFLE